MMSHTVVARPSVKTWNHLLSDLKNSHSDNAARPDSVPVLAAVIAWLTVNTVRSPSTIASAHAVQAFENFWVNWMADFFSTSHIIIVPVIASIARRWRTNKTPQPLRRTCRVRSTGSCRVASEGRDVFTHPQVAIVVDRHNDHAATNEVQPSSATSPRLLDFEVSEV